MNKVPLIICGAHGRMGQALIAKIQKSSEYEFLAAVVKNPMIADGAQYFSKLEPALANTNKKPVILDFSSQTSLKENLSAALKHQAAILIGTTGHDQANILAMKEASSSIPLLYAPNTSIMANLLAFLSAYSAKIIDNADIQISEIHHKNKKDAPSGTALMIAQTINKAKNLKESNIGFSSMRGGNVAGEHTVHFLCENERLELVHRVNDRSVFAQGALIAALFLFNQHAGLYDMNDVLNLN